MADQHVRRILELQAAARSIKQLLLMGKLDSYDTIFLGKGCKRLIIITIRMGCGEQGV